MPDTTNSQAHDISVKRFNELMGIRNRMTALGIDTSAVDEVISSIVKVFVPMFC